MIRVIRRLRALALVALVVPAVAFGQAWPSKPVRLISPFAAGGGTDAFARPLAQVLSQNLGQQFIVDNRPGAGGTVGADIAAKSPPDGYTFLVGAIHHTIAVSVYSKLPYDLEKDLVPVTMVAMVPSVIVVHPKVPATSVKELISYAKANPAKLNFGSAGNGTSHQLNAELFQIRTGTKMNHIPYKGAGPAMQALLGGEVDLVFDGMGTSAPQIKANRLRPLAVTTAQRTPAFPDIPTLQESGVPDIDVTTWYALWAPAGTPPDIVAKMQQEVAKALASPLLKQVWADNAATGGGNASADFARFVKAEIARWAEVAKASGARID
jgi:tripartite-type tricarboxylate transporter receptor subunit TctC